jgi:hypothetical protein
LVPSSTTKEVQLLLPPIMDHQRHQVKTILLLRVLMLKKIMDPLKTLMGRVQPMLDFR